MSVPYVNTDRLRRLAESIERLFKPSQAPSYLHHSHRVANYAARIATDEGLNVEEVTAAALVHDVGMVIDSSFLGHPRQTAVLAPQLLREAGFPSDRGRVITCVAASHHPRPDETLSDPCIQAVFDADVLEIVGVFGFLRWFGAIPADIRDLAESAQLFVDIVESGRSSRSDFFYTKIGRQLGSEPLLECVDLCKSLILFIQESQVESASLSPKSFHKALQHHTEATKTSAS